MMKKLFVALCALPLLGGQFANAQDDSPNLGAVEIFQCNYNKGKGAKDLDKVVEKWNKWADESGLVAYNAWVLTAAFGSPDYDFDVAWLGAWNNAAEMGKGLQQWKVGGANLQKEFDRVVDCSGHAAFNSANFKPPVQDEWPEEGVIVFSDCTIAEGKKLEDSIKVHAAWAKHLNESGSKAGMWGFYPAMGGATSDSDYKIVTGHPNFESLGMDHNNFTNGRGWEKDRAITEGKISCDIPRVYNSALIRNGGVTGG